MSAWAWLDTSIVEREAVLFAVRDLVALIVVLAVVLWITAAGTIYAGLFPTRIIGFAAKAAVNMR